MVFEGETRRRASGRCIRAWPARLSQLTLPIRRAGARASLASRIPTQNLFARDPSPTFDSQPYSDSPWQGRSAGARL